jgi:hypothetical protein
VWPIALGALCGGPGYLVYTVIATGSLLSVSGLAPGLPYLPGWYGVWWGAILWLALELRERGSDAEATRAAHWMIAWTLRAMGKTEEALQIQLRLHREADAAGRPDPDVLEELEALYQAAGDTERARVYRQRREALSQKSPGG